MRLKHCALNFSHSSLVALIFFLRTSRRFPWTTAMIWILKFFKSMNYSSWKQNFKLLQLTLNTPYWPQKLNLSFFQKDSLNWVGLISFFNASQVVLYTWMVENRRTGNYKILHHSVLTDSLIKLHTFWTRPLQGERACLRALKCIFH